MKVKLGVNVDHVATVRQQRRGTIPSVLEAALAAERAGADSITVHLREDRRHIQDADVLALRKSLRTKLNLEMAAEPEIVRFARKVKPQDCCLVPERRRELTTEGGLDVAGQKVRMKSVVRELKSAGIQVSLFVDPEPRQIAASAECGADCVELHTGTYAEAGSAARANAELKKLMRAAAQARSAGLTVNAGHGLDYDNVRPVARIEGMHELNIGFSIVARSIFVGLPQAVREMKARIQR